MKLSDRIINLNGEPGADDGWAVYYEARRLIDAGEAVTMLCIGEHDQVTAPFILDAMDASARGGNTGYAYIQGQPGLRDAVAARASRTTGVPTRAENVTITTGGQAALFACMSAALDPGDTCCVVDPYYATYPPTVRGAGANVAIVRANADNGFQLDPDELMEATRGAGALLVNTPHNPTGAVYSARTLEAIAAACIANDLWLISDEVYDSQVHEGSHVSPRSLPGMAERTMVVGSMSKSHVMTGFRLGWVIADRQVILAMRDLANATTYGVPGFIQQAAETALREGDGEQARVGARYKRRRDIAVKVLSGSNVLLVSPPEGAMYVMVDLRHLGVSAEAFALALLAREKIAVMPGESFGAVANGFVRIALTVADDDLAEALTRLRRFAEEFAQ